MSNQSLAALQQQLQNFLLDKQRSMNDLTLETPGFTREERLGIYHEAYRLRLIDALRNDFPAVEIFVNEEDFIAIATEYINQHPSRHPSLRWFGEKLPLFLAEHPQWKNNISLAELSAFEWAQVMAFDAADITPVTLDHVRALQPEQWMTMKLLFHPSMQLLKCYSNAPELWNALIKTETPIDVQLSENPQQWLVSRENLQVVYRPLDTAEAWTVQNFLQQQDFANTCAGLCEWFPEEQVPIKVAQFLQQWITSGLVIELIVD